VMTGTGVPVTALTSNGTKSVIMANPQPAK
jgi:hypothetical protein